MERPGARSGGVGLFGLVPHTGFEPVISALRGRCPGPLDECGEVRAGREGRTGRNGNKGPAGVATGAGARRRLRGG
jgi:hypothetical protein